MASMEALSKVEAVTSKGVRESDGQRDWKAFKRTAADQPGFKTRKEGVFAATRHTPQFPAKRAPQAATASAAAADEAKDDGEAVARRAASDAAVNGAPALQESPSAWSELVEPETKRTYWFNSSTGETAYEKPASAAASTKAADHQGGAKKGEAPTSATADAQVKTGAANLKSTAKRTRARTTDADTRTTTTSASASSSATMMNEGRKRAASGVASQLKRQRFSSESRNPLEQAQNALARQQALQAAAARAIPGATPAATVVADAQQAEASASAASAEAAAAAAAADAARQWTRVLDPTTRRTYWFHKQTRETTWTRPASLGPERKNYWLRSRDPDTGKLTWYNRKTGEPRRTHPLAG
ncbi:Hypothetical Protein FCC1311_051672 [Hondaea fermentalgiana]|uniref:WW domain-containing protein n=1 Tax=Hondaea fermentalgiana TaxID=2315210 RepID=A0A2R5GDB0_9STRA|nr:Hypothetical Protein FCC1311_051672 [Hondaea fermentalgiana]|eukprot:GBG28946.1 Hypothetical Protein FCC1311_051672 [Hondaea fermentalgiana]